MAQGEPAGVGDPTRWTSDFVPRANALDGTSAAQLLRSGPEGVRAWNEFRAKFAGAAIDEGALEGAHLDGLNLVGCNLAGLNLRAANLEGSDLTNADLTGSDLSNARLLGAMFRGASLRNTNLEGCALAAYQLAGADVSSSRLPAGIDVAQQLKVVEDASKNCRTLFLGVLGACFFTFLTIGQTQDADLLFGGGASPLPFVGTEIPTVGFYYITPVVLFSLFLYLHLYLQHLWRLVAELPAQLPDGRRVDNAIYPWLLGGLTSRYVTRLSGLARDYSGLRWVASLLTAWIMVPLTIWYVWGRAVARHDIWLSGVHIATLLATSLLALYSFRQMRATLGALPGPGVATTGDGMVLAAWLAGIFGACGLAVVWSHEPATETTAAWHRANAVDPLQGAQQRLYAVPWHQVLGYHPFSVGIRAREARLAGNDLSHLDLRIADLTGADLVGARLSDTWLHGANLTGAKLDRANASRTSFVGADFTGTTLAETELTDSDFRDAKGLTEAQLQSGCGTGHVIATVEGFPKRYWFKLRPCKTVAERLRREQAAAEARARQAQTVPEKQAAKRDAKRAAEEALQAELQQALAQARAEKEREQTRVKSQLDRSKAEWDKARSKAEQEQGSKPKTSSKPPCGCPPGDPLCSCL